LSDKTGPEA
jgi:hypothetical protein